MSKIDAGKYFSPRVIINLSILVGFLLFVSLLVSFLGNEIRDKAERIQSQRAEIEGRISDISRLAELRTAARNAEPALAQLVSLLPKRDELISFPRYLDTLAKNNRLQHQFTFTGQESNPAENIAGSSNFKLTLNGAYRDVLAFVEDIESGQFIVRVNLIDMVVGANAQSFKAELEGSVFFRG